VCYQAIEQAILCYSAANLAIDKDKLRAGKLSIDERRTRAAGISLTPLR